MKQLNNEKSFTLLELLIVIAVIAILAAIVIVSLSDAQQRAREARGMNFSQNIRTTLSNDLVGEWTFDDSTDLGRDLSNNNPNATISGAVYNPDGRVRGALDFDGIDDFVNLGNGEKIRFERAGNFTWEFWIKINSFDSSYHAIFSEYNSTNYKWLGLQSTRQGAVRFDYGGSADYTPVILKPGVWQHLVLTHTANTNNYLIYVNGGLEDTLVSGGTGPNTANKIIGNSTSASYPFNGAIDEVRLYKSVLTTREVQQLYAESLPRHLSEK